VTGITRRLWQTAGWLTLVYVVLTLVGSVFEPNVTIGDKTSHVVSGLVTSSMTKAFAGGYIEFIATLVFLVAGLLIARLLRGTGDLPAWLSSCINGAAIVYAAVGLAAGSATGAAAIYDAHHGAPLAVVTTVDDVRNVAFSLAGGVAGLLTLAIAGAGQATRLLPRWICYAGYVVGVVMIGAVPAARAGAPQVMLWFAWLIAFGVVAVRLPRRLPLVAGRVVPAPA
jgi:hypothetical protein